MISESPVFLLDSCAKVEVSGNDHVEFLHHILSQDILGMSAGEWRETALLSATSHVLAYMFAVKLENSILLLGMPSASAKIISLLEKFLITEDVSIRNAESDWDLFEAWGPKAKELTQKNKHYQPEGAMGPRFLILSEKNFCRFEIEKDKTLREILRIENGILEWEKDFGENIMLSETRLEKKAASETKGCYPGQEVVAKIETYKRLNRSFVRLSFISEKLPEVNSIICSVAGEEIGRLTSRAYSPFLKKGVGLGWLKRGFFEQPIEVSIKSETTISASTSPFKN